MFLKPNNTTPPAATNNAQQRNTLQPGVKRTVPSVVSSDMNILGNIVSEGIVDFDGIIDGNIRCASLVLRHNGKVNGEIHADSVQIYGTVKGLIKAKSVCLHATCAVEGIVMHEAISIEDGATIDGKIKRTNKAMMAIDKPAESQPVEYQEFDEYEDGSSEDEEAPRMLENIRLISA